MYIKTIVSVDGINTVDFSGSVNRFYWFHNIGTTTVYVSDRENAVAGNDGVAELSAGNTVCIETEKDRVYILGSGKVEIHNTRSKLCPFKSAPAVAKSSRGDIGLLELLAVTTGYSTGTISDTETQVLSEEVQ